MVAKQGFSSLFSLQEEELRDDKKRQQQQLQKRLRWNPLMRPPTGNGNLSVLTGVKAYHSLVLHTRALLLPRLTQSDQTEEKNKLTNQQTAATNRLTAEGTVT